MKTLSDSKFVFVFLLYFLVRGTESLKCYRCDGLNQARSDCPGWRRRPVDTFRDLGDITGLYTHCVDVRLSNGTVLYQNTQSLHPICVGSFLQMWKQTLMQEYKTEVSVLCCDYDRCNGPNAGKDSLLASPTLKTVITTQWLIWAMAKMLLA